MSERNTNYHLKDTWEQKYRATTCEKTEWIDNALPSFQAIRQYLPEDTQIKILELGCGSSALAEKIFAAGYTNITCVDYSKQIIKHRRTKNKEISFVLADFTEPFKFAPEQKYDLIIDKGSLDCIFCMEDFLKTILTTNLHCYNNLKEGGRLISISLGLPKNRKYWFRNKITPFQLQVKKLKNKFRQQLRNNNPRFNKDKGNEDYYMYVCLKSDNQIQGQANGNNIQGLEWGEESIKPKDQQNQQHNISNASQDQKQEETVIKQLKDNKQYENKNQQDDQQKVAESQENEKSKSASENNQNSKKQDDQYEQQDGDFDMV